MHSKRSPEAEITKIPLYRSETLSNKVREICDLMSRDSFLEKEDEISENYKVLDSFSYLFEIINAIAIYEEPSNPDSTSQIIYN